MRVIRAEEMGMCFGVRDALQVIHEIPDPTKVTIHGELVHNPIVISQLQTKGFRQSSEADRDIPDESEKVLITAHGISNRERQRLLQAKKKLIDTTCPLVHRAHSAAMDLQSEGRHVIVIGTPGHVEVIGIVDDLTDFSVVRSARDVIQYDSVKLGVMCQTTMPVDDVAKIRQQIVRQNPLADIRFIDTVCHPTKKRQTALLDLVDQVDAVVVVGGHNSNNTHRLVQQCQALSRAAFHVASADELKREWFANVATVGITAGTSTLPETVDSVQRVLESFDGANE